MAAITTVLAVAAAASAAVGVASYVEAKEANADAREARNKAAEEQKKMNAEQNAINQGKAATDRRQQIREERVRRAKILQASENSGVTGSSGQIGAIDNLSNQFTNAVGTNLGMQAAGQRISIFSQNAADLNTQAVNSDMKAAQSKDLFNLSATIFNATGGTGAIKAGLK